MRELGFDPYIAVAEQSLRGIRENIFGQLRTSEYFIFVDFKREVLANSIPLVHRGSLFSHQELAIASFLDTEVLAFQETGVKHDDGIIRFLQTNAIAFIDRHTLANVVADLVRKRGWNPSWRNELVLKRRSEQFSDTINPTVGNKLGRYFHIDVCNHHREKIATNCYAYLEKAFKLAPRTEIPLKAIEFKWAGTMLPSIGLPAGTVRQFDAFYIWYDMPTVLQFHTFTDSPEYYPRIAGTGTYELSYLVTAENFPAARGTFAVTIGSGLASLTFKALEPAEGSEGNSASVR